MGVPLSLAGAAGAAVNLRINGRPGYRTRITGAYVSFSAAPAAAVAFQFQEGGQLTSRFNVDVGGAGLSNLSPPDDGWLFEVGQDVTAAVAAPGGAVVAKVNVAVDYVPEGGSSP